MADELNSRDQGRLNRKHVLEALHSETGVWCGDPDSAARVEEYCDDPLAASTTEFGYVGGLKLRRWYVGEGKPNASERRGLWKEIRTRMEITAADPEGWSGESDVKQLQAIAEEA